MCKMNCSGKFNLQFSSMHIGAISMFHCKRVIKYSAKTKDEKEIGLLPHQF
jgi:hypothetical protein